MKLKCKFSLVAVLLFSFLYLHSQTSAYALLSFSKKSNSYFFEPKLKVSADSALIIAAAILNSQEFRDSIALYQFPCKNYDTQCRKKCKKCDDIITFKVIMDSLYRLKRDSLRLVMSNDGNCGGGSFGYSYEDVFEITSHYITISCDDKLSFAYKYAYHICHEYMHIVGFYHYLKPKKRIRNKDIAEQTGWTAYHIIKRWVEKSVKIPGI